MIPRKKEYLVFAPSSSQLISSVPEPHVFLREGSSAVLYQTLGQESGAESWVHPLYPVFLFLLPRCAACGILVP